MDRAQAVRGIVRSALTAAVRGAVVSCSFGRIAETAAIGKEETVVLTGSTVGSSVRIQPVTGDVMEGQSALPI